MLAFVLYYMVSARTMGAGALREWHIWRWAGLHACFGHTVPYSLRANALSDRGCSLLQNEQGSQSSADDENWELFKADDFRMYCMKVPHLLLFLPAFADHISLLVLRQDSKQVPYLSGPILSRPDRQLARVGCVRKKDRTQCRTL